MGNVTAQHKYGSSYGFKILIKKHFFGRNLFKMKDLWLCLYLEWDISYIILELKGETSKSNP